MNGLPNVLHSRREVDPIDPNVEEIDLICHVGAPGLYPRY